MDYLEKYPKQIFFSFADKMMQADNFAEAGSYHFTATVEGHQLAIFLECFLDSTGPKVEYRLKVDTVVMCVCPSQELGAEDQAFFVKLFTLLESQAMQAQTKRDRKANQWYMETFMR